MVIDALGLMGSRTTFEMKNVQGLKNDDNV